MFKDTRKESFICYVCIIVIYIIEFVNSGLTPRMILTMEILFILSLIIINLVPCSPVYIPQDLQCFDTMMIIINTSLFCFGIFDMVIMVSNIIYLIDILGLVDAEEFLGDSGSALHYPYP